jgi:hypothetical protein
MLLRLALVFVFGIGLGALGISRALDALSAPEAASVSNQRVARPADARALRAAANRSRLPQTLPSPPRADRSR